MQEHVRAVGRVIPAGKMRLIQHLEGGIVSQIEVVEGQTVKQGDILFYIENNRAMSELQELQVAMKAEEIKRIRLEAELAGEKVLVYPKEVAANYSDIVESQKQLFKARKLEHDEKLNGLETRMKQKILKLDDLDATTRNLRQELSVSNEQLEIKKRLRQSGAISRSQYLDTLSDVKDFETRIEGNQKEIPIVKAELAELTSLIEETNQKWKSEVSEQLNDTQVQIKTLSERIKASTDEVKRTAAKAPVNGIVQKVNVTTIGGVIQPGSVIAEIMPIEDNLIVEGRVSTNDRGKVWPGLDVVAKISAYDYTIYGTLYGKLIYISPNSFIDGQGSEFYTVRVSLDSLDLGKDNPVYPGMTAELNIMANEVSVLHAIMKPFRQIKDNALREK